MSSRRSDRKPKSPRKPRMLFGHGSYAQSPDTTRDDNTTHSTPQTSDITRAHSAHLQLRFENLQNGGFQNGGVQDGGCATRNDTAPQNPDGELPPMVNVDGEVPGDLKAFYGHPLAGDNPASALALLHEYQNLPAIATSAEGRLRERCDSFSDYKQQRGESARATRGDASSGDLYSLLMNSDVDAFLNIHNRSVATPSSLTHELHPSPGVVISPKSDESLHSSSDLLDVSASPTKSSSELQGPSPEPPYSDIPELSVTSPPTDLPQPQVSPVPLSPRPYPRSPRKEFLRKASESSAFELPTPADHSTTGGADDFNSSHLKPPSHAYSYSVTSSHFRSPRTSVIDSKISALSDNAGEPHAQRLCPPVTPSRLAGREAEGEDPFGLFGSHFGYPPRTSAHTHPRLSSGSYQSVSDVNANDSQPLDMHMKLTKKQQAKSSYLKRHQRASESSTASEPTDYASKSVTCTSDSVAANSSSVHKSNITDEYQRKYETFITQQDRGREQLSHLEKALRAPKKVKEKGYEQWSEREEDRDDPINKEPVLEACSPLPPPPPYSQSAFLPGVTMLSIAAICKQIQGEHPGTPLALIEKSLLSLGFPSTMAGLYPPKQLQNMLPFLPNHSQLDAMAMPWGAPFPSQPNVTVPTTRAHEFGSPMVPTTSSFSQYLEAGLVKTTKSSTSQISSPAVSTPSLPYPGSHENHVATTPATTPTMQSNRSFLGAVSRESQSNPVEVGIRSENERYVKASQRHMAALKALQQQALPQQAQSTQTQAPPTTPLSTPSTPFTVALPPPTAATLLPDAVLLDGALLSALVRNALFPQLADPTNSSTPSHVILPKSLFTMATQGFQLPMAAPPPVTGFHGATVTSHVPVSHGQANTPPSVSFPTLTEYVKSHQTGMLQRILQLQSSGLPGPETLHEKGHVGQISAEQSNILKESFNQAKRPSFLPLSAQLEKNNADIKDNASEQALTNGQLSMYPSFDNETPSNTHAPGVTPSTTPTPRHYNPCTQYTSQSSQPDNPQQMLEAAAMVTGKQAEYHQRNLLLAHAALISGQNPEQIFTNPPSPNTAQAQIRQLGQLLAERTMSVGGTMDQRTYPLPHSSASVSSTDATPTGYQSPPSMPFRREPVAERPQVVLTDPRTVALQRQGSSSAPTTPVNAVKPSFYRQDMATRDDAHVVDQRSDNVDFSSMENYNYKRNHIQPVSSRNDVIYKSEHVTETESQYRSPFDYDTSKHLYPVFQPNVSLLNAQSMAQYNQPGVTSSNLCVTDASTSLGIRSHGNHLDAFASTIRAKLAKPRPEVSGQIAHPETSEYLSQLQMLAMGHRASHTTMNKPFNIDGEGYTKNSEVQSVSVNQGHGLNQGVVVSSYMSQGADPRIVSSKHGSSRMDHPFTLQSQGLFPVRTFSVETPEQNTPVTDQQVPRMPQHLATENDQKHPDNDQKHLENTIHAPHIQSSESMNSSSDFDGDLSRGSFSQPLSLMNLANASMDIAALPEPSVNDQSPFSGSGGPSWSGAGVPVSFSNSGGYPLPIHSAELMSPDSGIGESCVSPSDSATRQSRDPPHAAPSSGSGLLKRRRPLLSNKTSAATLHSPTAKPSSIVTSQSEHHTGAPASTTSIAKLSAAEVNYRCYLETPISASQKIEDDRITYLNKGQFYSLVLEYTAPTRLLPRATVKSVVLVVFRDDKGVTDEFKAWQFWHSRQHSYKQRILDMDLKGCSGISLGSVEETAFNAFTFRWEPMEQSAKISIAINCLSTDFSNQKGVKGLPLHVQVDTYEDESATPSHRAYCQTKIFCDKGAERKTRDEVRKKEVKIKQSGDTGESPTVANEKPGKLFHPPCDISELYNVADLLRAPVLFSPLKTTTEGASPPPKAIVFPTIDPKLAAVPSAPLVSTPVVDSVEPAPKRPRQTVAPSSRVPEEKVLLYVRESHETVFTALLLLQPSLAGLLKTIEEKYNIPVSQVANVYKRSKKGILVKMDDNIVRNYASESTFLITLHQRSATCSSGAGSYDITLQDLE